MAEKADAMMSPMRAERRMVPAETVDVREHDGEGGSTENGKPYHILTSVTVTNPSAKECPHNLSSQENKQTNL